MHAEIDGERLEEHEIVMGFFLLVAAGNDSTKATFCSGIRALLEDPEQRRLVIEDPSLIPGAVEEALRMFPAFAHFRRTATRDTELGGQRIKEGEKVVMWYTSSNRDEDVYEDPDRFDLRRTTEHQAFGAGGRHFCLGTRAGPPRAPDHRSRKRSPAIPRRSWPAGPSSPSRRREPAKALPVRLG